MSRSRAKRIDVLKARAGFLSKRVAEREGSLAGGYDRAEMNALLWAIPILMGHVEANRVLHEQLRAEGGRRVDDDLGYE